MSLHLKVAKGVFDSIENVFKSLAADAHKNATDEWKKVLGHIESIAGGKLQEIEKKAEEVCGDVTHLQDHQRMHDIPHNPNAGPKPVPEVEPNLAAEKEDEDANPGEPEGAGETPLGVASVDKGYGAGVEEDSSGLDSGEGTIGADTSDAADFRDSKAAKGKEGFSYAQGSDE